MLRGKRNKYPDALKRQGEAQKHLRAQRIRRTFGVMPLREQGTLILVNETVNETTLRIIELNEANDWPIV